ncbi:TPA: hypothetical protein ACW5QC_004195 [Salmonella enterica subsp. enterica serovar Narashino]
MNFSRDYNRQRRSKRLVEPKDNGNKYDPMASLRARGIFAREGVK